MRLDPISPFALCESGEMDRETKRRLLGYGACALASSFWGCGFFFGKIALAEMSSSHMVLYRFIFGVIPLLPLALLHRPHLNRGEWGLLLVASFLGVPVQFLIQFYALSITTVSHAALMVGTMPVILAIGAVLFAHERLDAVGWFALAGSTSGAALIALSSHRTHVSGGPSLAGDLLVVLSLAIALFWILFNKRLMDRHSHVVVDGVRSAAGDGHAGSVGRGAGWLAAGAWCVGGGVVGTHRQRRAVYGDDDPAVELGYDAGTGVQGGRAPEHGAADR